MPASQATEHDIQRTLAGEASPRFTLGGDFSVDYFLFKEVRWRSLLLSNYVHPALIQVGGAMLLYLRTIVDLESQ
jgi:hypothetical protein